MLEKKSPPTVVTEVGFLYCSPLLATFSRIGEVMERPLHVSNCKSTEQKRKAIKKNMLQLPQYVSMLIRTFMTAISREYVNAKYWHNTVVVNIGEISAVDFSLSPEIKNTLFGLGYATTKEFLPKKCAGVMKRSALDVS